MKKPKLVEWTVDEKSALKTEVDTIALVDQPAIEVNFTTLSKQNKTFNLEETPELEEFLIKSMMEDSIVEMEPDKKVMQKLQGKNLLATPIMIANKPIYRIGIDWDALEALPEDTWDLPEDEIIDILDQEVFYDYYGYWPEDTVRQSSHIFQKKSYQDSWNLMHDKNLEAKGVSLVESWIVEDSFNDKSNSFGYALNPGSWFGIVKIDNQALWDEYIASGTLKGVSVEVWQNENIIETYGKTLQSRKFEEDDPKINLVKKVYQSKIKAK